MRLDPDIAQELFAAATEVATRSGPRLTRALQAAEANDAGNRRVAQAVIDEDWFGVVAETLRADDRSRVAHARAVVSALEGAGVVFPQRGRREVPQSPEEHLREAARLLEMSLTADDTQPGGYHVMDDHCSAQVAAANVHARIGHAWAALAMLAGREGEPDAPGLAALERLADSVGRLAEVEGSR